jgi:murein DD-endopeptidase MepM/ murein hydrolase activator NlpD
MKAIFFFAISLIPCLIFAQPESEILKKIAGQFEEHYNANSADQIFELFSPDMKVHLPIEKTTDFVNQLQTQAGKIVLKSFVGYKNTGFASYKTEFERALYAMNISLDNEGKINGLFFAPFKESNLPSLERNKTGLNLPFKGSWYVFWGGDTKALNYHVESEAQKHAFDFVIRDEQGKSYKNEGKTNADYYAFGKELIAPCDARVVLVIDGIKDNIPGEFNPMYIPGNTVILKTEQDEFLFFAHFKQLSIVVEQGEFVKKGDLLGLCGNSGNSSEPHLHFHMQNVEDINQATGAKVYFDKILVNGEEKSDYSPIKGDFIEGMK